MCIYSVRLFDLKCYHNFIHHASASKCMSKFTLSAKMNAIAFTGVTPNFVNLFDESTNFVLYKQLRSGRERYFIKNSDTIYLSIPHPFEAAEFSRDFSYAFSTPVI